MKQQTCFSVTFSYIARLQLRKNIGGKLTWLYVICSVLTCKLCRIPRELQMLQKNTIVFLRDPAALIFSPSFRSEAQGQWDYTSGWNKNANKYFSNNFYN